MSEIAFLSYLMSIGESYSTLPDIWFGTSSFKNIILIAGTLLKIFYGWHLQMTKLVRKS